MRKFLSFFFFLFFVCFTKVLNRYAGLGPILFKQIPYTMAKFAVQGKAAEMM